MAQVKIQIKSIFREVLFEYEKENNTIRETVEEAVRQNANLNGANLNGASLNGANFTGQALTGQALTGQKISPTFLLIALPMVHLSGGKR